MGDLRDTAPYAKGNSASRQAAEGIQHKLTGIRGQVYAYIVRMGSHGATGSQIAEALDILPYTAKPRCSELRDAGHIFDTGKTRKNSNNKAETVWMTTSGDRTRPPEKAPVKSIGALAKAKAENKKMKNALNLIAGARPSYILKYPQSIIEMAKRGLPKDE